MKGLPWDYINDCKMVMDAFAAGVDWDELKKCFWDSVFFWEMDNVWPLIF